ncbi:GNAT family N-acetyltransferase [Brevibacterium casei]|uniref:N-acetyltransferase n=1 Tax=Brevibacterium casei TaxID=33889 RepID=A0A7T3ZZC7_9MICO|nr:GNAT family N-acetyltransferase [Brevibacterium casei]QQB14474.1 N-acetyltransferase [Brevibacterium casei]
MDVDIDGETYTIAHDPDQSRFTVTHDGTVIGTADYVDTDATEAGVPTVRTFTHTIVDPAYGGRGIAAKLVRFALESTTEADLRFRTTCSYVMRFLEKNHEFDASLA